MEYDVFFVSALSFIFCLQSFLSFIFRLQFSFIHLLSSVFFHSSSVYNFSSVCTILFHSSSAMQFCFIHHLSVHFCVIHHLSAQFCFNYLQSVILFHSSFVRTVLFPSFEQFCFILLSLQCCFIQLVFFWTSISRPIFFVFSVSFIFVSFTLCENISFVVSSSSVSQGSLY